MSAGARRVVCLSAEAADWLWRLGAWDRVAGVPSYFELPPGAEPRPRVPGGFSRADAERVAALRPDLVVAFSDVQADLVAKLLRLGLPVLATNQRTLAETEEALGLIARCAGCAERAEGLLREFREALAPVPPPPRRPRVYFEEWNRPLVTGIAWVGELIERAGGEDVFAELRFERAAAGRVVEPERVIAARPDVIFVSWCGKPVRVEEIAARPGWQELPAVRRGRIYEIAGADILQPGFRLTAGYEIIRRHLAAVA